VVTSPIAGAIVEGVIVLTAMAFDDVGVVGVRFRMDGAPLGTEDTSAPYGVAWYTTTPWNGAHTLTAVARDAAGNLTTSASVNITVASLPWAVDT
jgi:Bacterial Ig domain